MAKKREGSVDWTQFENDSMDEDGNESVGYDSISDDSSIDVDKIAAKARLSAKKSPDKAQLPPKAAFTASAESKTNSKPPTGRKATPGKKKTTKKDSDDSSSSSSSSGSDSENEQERKRRIKTTAQKKSTTNVSGKDPLKETGKAPVNVIVDSPVVSSVSSPASTTRPQKSSKSKGPPETRSSAPLPTAKGKSSSSSSSPSSSSAPSSTPRGGHNEGDMHTVDVDSRASSAASSVRSPQRTSKSSAKVFDASNLAGAGSSASHVRDQGSLNVGTEYCRLIRTASYLNAIKVANGTEPKVLSASADSTIHVHSISNGRPFPSLEGHTDRVIALAVADPMLIEEVNPETGEKTEVMKTLVVSGARDQILRIWDLDNSKCIHSIHAHKSPIWAVAIAARKDGSVVVISTSGDGSMRSWNGKTGKKMCNFKGHTDKVLSVFILNPLSDQPLVFSAGADRKIRVWDLLTGAHIKLFEGHEDEINSVVAQSYSSMSSLVPISMDNDEENHQMADGTDSKGSVIIVSACRDLTIRVWDYKSGYLLFELLGHTACVFEVALCRTVKGVGLMGGVATKHQVAAGTPIIVSCSDDATIKFWNLENGKMIKSVKWHNVSVRGIDVVVLKPNANSQSINDLFVIVSCGWDKTIQFHPVDEAINLKDRVGCNVS